MKRRPRIDSVGPAHFITARTNKRLNLFSSGECCSAFFAAVREVKDSFPFELYAYVLMPDHFHLLVKPEDGDISSLMRKVKSQSARKIIAQLKEQEQERWLDAIRKPREGRRKHTYQVWQQSFRSLHIVTPILIRQKIDYIHKNPWRAGLVSAPGEYAWSSWRAFEREGAEPIALDRVPL